MIEQLQNVNNIYDLLALCCSYILNEFKQSTYEFASFNEEKYESVFNAIENYITAKEEEGHKKAFDELREFLIDFFRKGINIEKTYAVVKYIDDLVEIELVGNLLIDKGIIQYATLNLQYTNQIRIIPKLRETLMTRSEAHYLIESGGKYSYLRDRRECPCSVLDAVTVNYKIWDKQRIDQYPLKIYHIEEKNPIAKHFINRDRIVLGIVPFTKRKLEDIFDILFEKGCFCINNMKESAEQELKKRYVEVYERSRKADIDFLIFPEMLMTENILSSIQEKEKNGGPQIIINGSIWKDKINRTIVTNNVGTEILSYCKKEPFIYKKNNKKYKEHLDRTKNREYAILEINNVGRIGICICKDLVNEDVKLFHKYINTDLLVAPAYTKSMDLMSAAEELSKDYKCIVAVANACSAIEEKEVLEDQEKIGFISIPAKKGSERSEILKFYFKDNCVKECENKCMGKAINIIFMDTQEYLGGIGIRIEDENF
ncbi:MAG: hypothetical protein J6B50_12750 [Lachnospiraceae bacterium]|nr:hypothetical protein [Lachnospiraceae bacterium]